MTPPRKGWRLKREDWFVIVPAVFAVTLGTVGFIFVEPKPNAQPDDPFFRALSLLTGGGAEANLNWCLRVARWCGVVFGFAAVTRFLARNLGASVTTFRTKRARRHEVIIGLGWKGRTLLKIERPKREEERPKQKDERRERKYGPPPGPLHYLWPVDRVGLDRDVTSVDGASLGKRSLVVAGDATTDEALELVSVADASRVIIATKEDALNVAIAGRIAKSIPAARKGNPLRLTVHVADPVLRNEAFPGTPEGTPVIVSPFALPATAARTVLRRFPVAVRAREQGAPGVNLVFIGFDDYAEAVLIHALRLGRLTSPKQAHARVTVFAAKEAEVEDRLRRRYAPAFEDKLFGLENAIRVVPFDLARELGASEVLPTEPDGQPVTAVFVQAETDAAAYALALRTRKTARAHGVWKAPFFVRLDEPEALSGSLTVLPGHPSPDQSVSPILEEVLEPYGALAPTLKASVYEERRTEQLAAAIHEEYVKEHRRDARPVAKDDWSRLAEETREANRRAIDHVGLKLASAGFVVRGDALHAREALGLGEGAIGNALAELEHESWSREKLLAGWRFGTPRNNARRRHDCLVEFTPLNFDLQIRDLEQIRALGKRLVSSGAKPQPMTIFRERVIAVVSDTVAARGKDAAWLRDAIGSELKGLDVESNLGPKGDEFWTIVTPLAPGADCVFARKIAEELGRFPGRFRVRVVQPLPLPLLVAAWRDRGGFALGTPDGASALKDAAQEDEPGDSKEDAPKPLIPDLRKVEDLLRKLMRDPALGIEACVDLSPASLSVSDWSGEDFTKKPPFVATMDEAAKRFETYVLGCAHVLVAACSVAPLAEKPTGAVDALVRAWNDAKNRTGLHVISFD